MSELHPGDLPGCNKLVYVAWAHLACMHAELPTCRSEVYGCVLVLALLEGC